MRDFTGHSLESDALAVRAMKRPIDVEVTFADADGVLRTREGAVRFRRGDALLTAPGKDRWPVQRKTFLARYEPLPPTRAMHDGRYRKQPVAVWARRMDQPFTVRVGHAADTLTGAPGDWLVQYGPDDYGIISAEIFASTYDVVNSGEEGP